MVHQAFLFMGSLFLSGVILFIVFLIKEKILSVLDIYQIVEQATEEMAAQGYDKDKALDYMVDRTAGPEMERLKARFHAEAQLMDAALRRKHRRQLIEFLKGERDE